MADKLTINGKGEIMLQPDITPAEAALQAAVLLGSPEAIDKVYELYPQTSHGGGCAYRHKGECDCIKADMAAVLDEHGIDIP